MLERPACKRGPLYNGGDPLHRMKQGVPMVDLRIWPMEADVDAGDIPGDTYEVVDISGEGETLMIGTLEACRAEYPNVPVSD